MVSLYELRKGDSACVDSLVSERQSDLSEADHKVVLKRLIELGICAGTPLTVQWRDPLPGGPLVIEVRGGRIAIGRKEASLVQIEQKGSANP